MTLLPIVERELRVASRRKFTWRARFIGVLVALIVFGWQFALVSTSGFSIAEQGLYLFKTLVTVAFAYCLLAGVMATADSLSRERREGTLGLLFLTDLRGIDVILGKLVASSLNTAFGLMAMLPLLAIPVNLGGVSGEMLLQAALVLLNTLYFSLAAGIMVSGHCTDERRAAFWAALLVFLTIVLPWMTAFLVDVYFDLRGDADVLWIIMATSPGFGLMMVLVPPAIGTAVFPVEAFYVSLANVFILGCGMNWLAGRALATSWKDRTAKTFRERSVERLEKLAAGSSAQLRSQRSRLLDANPFTWLAVRSHARRNSVWLLVTSASLLTLWAVFSYDGVFLDRETMIPAMMALHGFLKLWIAVEACQRLVWDRRSGALELLLTTPQKPADIVRGQLHALVHQFALPMAGLVMAELVLLSGAVGFASVCRHGSMLFLDAVALGWIGIWSALHSRTTTAAIMKTIGWVVALPWVTHLGIIACKALMVHAGLGSFPVKSLTQWETTWTILGCTVDVGLGLVWARMHVDRHFKSVVSGAYDKRRSEVL